MLKKCAAANNWNKNIALQNSFAEICVLGETNQRRHKPHHVRRPSLNLYFSGMYYIRWLLGYQYNMVFTLLFSFRNKAPLP